MQKPLRELGLKRFWSAVKSSSSGSGSQGTQEENDDNKCGPTSSLPLLQVWPSSDSPRGEADGQSFVFPTCVEGSPQKTSETIQHNDSGIDSNQVSPSPIPGASSTSIQSPVPINRRASASLLHPDHARFVHLHQNTSQENVSLEDISESNHLNPIVSPSSSTNSSQASVAAAATTSTNAGNSRGSFSLDGRRRSSMMAPRYSLFDALDLEYALLRAAARGSVGPYSLSESLNKLTFTQSLAFPALAKGLAGKRQRSRTNNRARPLGGQTDNGIHAFAKIVTVLVLMLVSVLVFAVVYKFVRT